MRALAFWGLSLLAAGCGSGGSGFDGGNPTDDGGTGDETPVIVTDGSPGDGGCVNLQCQQVKCMGGGTTSLSGTVVTGGLSTYGPPDPVYNAIVYVPNAPVQPFAPGVACDKCGAPVSGNPVVVTLTGVDGKFKLDDVPVGANIPLVVQIGRWRRQIVVPTVTACVDTPLTKDQTRLPRKKSEGDIPHIAIATSTYDIEECILRKMGVDDSEFGVAGSNARVHLYHGNGTTLPNAQDKSMLTAAVNTLKQYDVTLFPCSSVPQIGSSPGQDGVNLKAFLDAGGRAFVTDLSYSWFKDGPTPFPGTAQWTTWGGIGVNPLPALVDQGFPKGKALAQWLQLVGATTMLGQIPLQQTYHVVDGVNAPTTRWLYSTSPATVQTLSFNTPVGMMPDQQCGRAVYSNFHVATGSGGGTTFPAECSASPLTAQEKVMEFMFLDLSSCVQTDTQPPMPPPK